MIDTNPNDFTLLDCRFSYEFEGGHIQNATNISCVGDLEKKFFNSKKEVESEMNKPIIFHCEFS